MKLSGKLGRAHKNDWQDSWDIGGELIGYRWTQEDSRDARAEGDEVEEVDAED